MFQLEVAQKLMGRPGTKDYGPLSILAQLVCRVTRLLKLGPGAFKPAPKVDSAVLVFEPAAAAPDLACRAALLAFLHRSFSYRRKTLANNWQGWLPPGPDPGPAGGPGPRSGHPGGSGAAADWLDLFHRPFPETIHEFRFPSLRQLAEPSRQG